MANEVKVVNGKIELAEQTLIDMRRYAEIKKEMDKTEKRIKAELLEAMANNGIKKFENDYMTITYVEPTTRVSIDTNALKSDGLYDIYSKEVDVKASVRVKYK